jgi:hypothetical protein
MKRLPACGVETPVDDRVGNRVPSFRDRTRGLGSSAWPMLLGIALLHDHSPLKTAGSFASPFGRISTQRIVLP